MDQLAQILTGFEAYLKKINAPILKKLNPGIKVKEQLDLIGNLSLPPEVNTLYSWKNGTNILPEDSFGILWLFDFGAFLPLSEAVKLYSDGVNNVEKWDKSKFPLFVSGGGEFYLLECDPDNKNFGMIYFHSVGDIEIDVIVTKYDSIQAFFASTLKCYEQGAYTFSDEGELVFNFGLECKICSKLNPNADFWK